MDNPIRVAVMGCNGRMGKVLLEAIANAEGVVVGAALERPGSAVMGLDAGELNGLGRLGVIISDSLEKVKDEFDLIIDFTRPEVTLANLAFALAHGKSRWLSAPQVSTTRARRPCTRRQADRHRLRLQLLGRGQPGVQAVGAGGQVMGSTPTSRSSRGTTDTRWMHRPAPRSPWGSGGENPWARI